MPLSDGYFLEIVQVPEPNGAIWANREQNSAVGVQIETANASAVRGKPGDHLEGVKANDADQALHVTRALTRGVPWRERK
jgi:hypothetical protein